MAQRADEWSTRELSAVVKEFGLHPLAFTPVRRAWRAETEDGPRFLKSTSLSLPELLFVAAAVDYLRRRGEPAPRWETGRHGLPWVERGGRRFVLSEWVEGREASFPEAADLRRAAEAVARLHRHGEGFQPPAESWMRVEWGRWPERFGRRSVQLEAFREAARQARDAFGRGYLALWPYHAVQARQALALLARSAYPEISAAGRRCSVICHHDLSERNFLVGPDGVRLIDFDYCLQDLAVHDLANLLQRLAQATGWEVQAAGEALSVYERVEPLTREERLLLAALLRWPHRYWLLGWQRYVERLPWPEERWLDALDSRLEEAERREGFLADLQAGFGLPRM
ncbi:MAG TPA: CotS family spore coat protein [Firmicutes bacterium]|nr:CotS family spore coat protein [Bacillota bacterium]